MRSMESCNGAPFFPFEIAGGLTFGGWLGGALQWHFAVFFVTNSNPGGYREDQGYNWFGGS